MRLATALMAGVILTGCSWVSEQTKFYMQRDWERLKGYDWGDSTAKLTGYREAFPTPSQREAQNERKICLHANGETRVVMQDGVSDAYEYRRCALLPYDTQGGQRMGNRPEPQS